MRLDADSYDSISKGNRPYSLVTVLTALGEQYGCQGCL
jgi:hypothetical protein